MENEKNLLGAADCLEFPNHLVFRVKPISEEHRRRLLLILEHAGMNYWIRPGNHIYVLINR